MMRRNKKSLTHLLDEIPTPIYVTSADNRYWFVNSAWEKLSHLNRQAVINRLIEEIFPGETSRQFTEINKQVISKGVPVIAEEFADINGGCCYFLTLKFPLWGNYGQVRAVGGVSIDISGLRKAKDNPEKSAESAERLESLVAKVAQAIAPSLQMDEMYKRLALENAEESILPHIRKMEEDPPRNIYLKNLRSKLLNLTSREIQVAHLIKSGKTSKEIAQIMNISVRTAESHRGNIRKKFGLTNKHANLASYLFFIFTNFPSVFST